MLLLWRLVFQHDAVSLIKRVAPSDASICFLSLSDWWVHCLGWDMNELFIFLGGSLSQVTASVPGIKERGERGSSEKEGFKAQRLYFDSLLSYFDASRCQTLYTLPHLNSSLPSAVQERRWLHPDADVDPSLANIRPSALQNSQWTSESPLRKLWAQSNTCRSFCCSLNRDSHGWWRFSSCLTLFLQIPEPSDSACPSRGTECLSMVAFTGGSCFEICLLLCMWCWFKFVVINWKQCFVQISRT